MTPNHENNSNKPTHLINTPGKSILIVECDVQEVREDTVPPTPSPATNTIPRYTDTSQLPLDLSNSSSLNYLDESSAGHTDGEDPTQRRPKTGLTGNHQEDYEGPEEQIQLKETLQIALESANCEINDLKTEILKQNDVIKGQLNIIEELQQLIKMNTQSTTTTSAAKIQSPQYRSINCLNLSRFSPIHNGKTILHNEKTKPTCKNYVDSPASLYHQLTKTSSTESLDAFKLQSVQSSKTKHKHQELVTSKARPKQTPSVMKRTQQDIDFKSTAVQTEDPCRESLNNNSKIDGDSNPKIFVIGDQKCKGLSKYIQESREYKWNNKYKIEGFVMTDATSSNIVEYMKSFIKKKHSMSDKIILTIGNNDNDVYMILKNLSVIADMCSDYKIFVIETSNSILGDKTLNYKLKSICNTFQNCKFIETTYKKSNVLKEYCYKINLDIDSLDYQLTFLNFSSVKRTLYRPTSKRQTMSQKKITHYFAATDFYRQFFRTKDRSNGPDIPN